eukprot:1902987-Rhodomonas_salina.1
MSSAGCARATRFSDLPVELFSRAVPGERSVMVRCVSKGARAAVKEVSLYWDCNIDHRPAQAEALAAATFEKAVAQRLNVRLVWRAANNPRVVAALLRAVLKTPGMAERVVGLDLSCTGDYGMVRRSDISGLLLAVLAATRNLVELNLARSGLRLWITDHASLTAGNFGELLGASLVHCRSLQKIDLSGNRRLRSSALQDVAAALGQLPDVRVFKANANQLGWQHLNVLVRAIAKWPRLEELALAGNDEPFEALWDESDAEGDEGAALVALLAGGALRGLRVLDLYHTRIRYPEAFTSELARACPRLQTLSMSLDLCMRSTRDGLVRQFLVHPVATTLVVGVGPWPEWCEGRAAVESSARDAGKRVVFKS